MPRAPGVIQGSTSFSTINASGATYMPLPVSVPQQSANSSNSMATMNINGPRWIGRANMNDDNPFCKLPGGGPKGVSDPVPPKSDADQSNHQSKRQCFRCDDCDINFAKYESLESHKNSHCIKRLKLSPSSTVTSHISVNNLLQPAVTTPSMKSSIEELSSAMAVKRSLLEASMKTALDAQYIINLHKTAQDLTKKSFKELDNALNREKALIPEASLQEQRIVSEAKAQALMRAEEAYKKEKYSAAAVEQALYRQKTAIEATLAATEHEQTALIATLGNLKVQATQGTVPSVFQAQYNNLSDEKSFNNDEKLVNTVTLIKTVSDLSSVCKASLSSTDVLTEKKNEIGTTSFYNALQNGPLFNIHSKEPSILNFGENKASALNVPPDDSPQPKQKDATFSYSSNNTPTFQQERLSCDNYHPLKSSNSNKMPSADVSSSPEYDEKGKSQVSSHSQELKNVFSKNIQPTVCYADKRFTQNIHSEEMMDMIPSSEHISVLNRDIQENCEPPHFLQRVVSGSSYFKE